MKKHPFLFFTGSLVLMALLLFPCSAGAYTSYSASSSSPGIINYNGVSYGVARSGSAPATSGTGTVPSQPVSPTPVPPPPPPPVYVPPVNQPAPAPVFSASYGVARSAPSYTFYSSPSTGTGQAPAVQPQPQPSPPPALPTDNLSALTQQERQLLQLVNRERISRGLAPLILDERLTRLARMKSMDMIVHKYFAHQSPTYGSSGDMLRSAGIRFSIAAENIGQGGSINAIFSAFMNSPGHRNKIIGSAYTHTGIGVYYQPGRGYVVTQLFMAPR